MTPSLAPRRVILPVIYGIALLIAWEALAHSGAVSRLVLAGPLEIVVAGVRNWSELGFNAGVTLAQALIGAAIGNVAGLLVAICFVHWGFFRRAVFPLAILCEAIPVVAILPVLILWLGNGMAPKIFVAAFLSFFPMLVNAYRGLSNVDEEVRELLYSYSATASQMLWKVRMPAAVPFMFTALKLSACSSMIASLVAEWLASERGLGFLVVYYGQSYRVADIWSAAILSCLISLGLYGITAACERRALSRSSP
ncbi:NitT/TauT family transport system permease protein [Faunimonas pinastri]|uniref:NitT/TauT family transport system permease protein n=1 Tax=Faunimonas pinastri TaxID=1855383 RepID=A0A1H9EQ29_9HYPH|nr:ABC transporter permease [Faunimonas pinastri]SEQ27715.1 NitT/TauT family transport system permease protein [Faunimonas pinastri]